MKNVFITGATGFIGSHLTLTLAKKGYTVYGLFRDPGKTKNLHHPNITWIKGDLGSIHGLASTISRCEGLFHTAALARMWSKNKSDFYKTNVEGTRKLLDVAINTGIKRIVLTSTASVFGPSGHLPVDENTISSTPCFSHYEETKKMSDALLLNDFGNKTEIVTVYPTRVFGPGKLSESNGVTRMIKKYLNGQWHVLPGDGSAIGNYVFIEDVVLGMLSAYLNGKPGQGYILAGENVSYLQFFQTLRQVSSKNYKLIKIPSRVIIQLAYLEKCFSKILKRPPLITPDFARKFLYNWRTSYQKATEDLNYHPTPFYDALQKTIDWLSSENLVPENSNQIR